MLLCGSNWKPTTFFSQSIFTLIKKNVRGLSLRNNEYTRDEGFLEGLWGKRFFDKTNFLLTSLFCLPCVNSVSYDFYCLILCKQTFNIIIIKILTAILCLRTHYSRTADSSKMARKTNENM